MSPKIFSGFSLRPLSDWQRVQTAVYSPAYANATAPRWGKGLPILVFCLVARRRFFFALLKNVHFATLRSLNRLRTARAPHPITTTNYRNRSFFMKIKRAVNNKPKASQPQLKRLPQPTHIRKSSSRVGGHPQTPENRRRKGCLNFFT